MLALTEGLFIEVELRFVLEATGQDDIQRDVGLLDRQLDLHALAQADELELGRGRFKAAQVFDDGRRERGG